MIFVETSTSYASPKLFSMKAIRLPSGDQDARSPKYDSRVMLDGRLFSGLPGRVPWAVTAATAHASVIPRSARDAGVIPRSARMGGFQRICRGLSRASYRVTETAPRYD